MNNQVYISLFVVWALSFEHILKKDLAGEINTEEYRHDFKERPHVSKSKIDEYSNAFYLEVGQSKSIHYKDGTETRYIAAVSMTYDTIISIYDVNTRNIIACRTFKYGDLERASLKSFVNSLKRAKPNLEARIIGMQSGQKDYSTMLSELIGFFASNSIKLVEVDMFGTNTRHIAIDSKLGTSYNILTEDRLFRPGELVNGMTVENFENKLKTGQQSPM